MEQNMNRRELFRGLGVAVASPVLAVMPCQARPAATADDVRRLAASMEMDIRVFEARVARAVQRYERLRG
jgi:hypothetical protein